MDQSSNSRPSPATTRTLAVLAALAVIWLAASLVYPTLASAPVQMGSDDGFYQRYMTEVASQGLGAIPRQFDWYMSNKANWIFPPPSRVGFSIASALWSHSFGTTFDALKQLSFASFLALIAVQFFFARRHFGNWCAVLIAALTAFSPLYMGLSRLALTDAFISLCQVTTIWLFFEVVRAPRSWAWRVAFVLVFAYAILTKEISVLLGLPFTVFVLIEHFHRKRELPVVPIVAALAIPPLLAIVGWTLAAGSFDALVRTMKIVMGSPATNEYAIRFGSGPWYRYLFDEMLVSAWPTLLGLCGIVVTAWRWRAREYDGARVYLALIYVFQIGVLAFFTKNLRYVAVLEAPLRVLAVLVIWDFFAGGRAWFVRAAPAGCVALLCWLDWSNFQQIFVTWQMYDPVTLQIAAARHLFPITDAPEKWIENALGK
jgi:4-amino-4-deoxy-L-arabinose transferase-like glycosyltransferase